MNTLKNHYIDPFSEATKNLAYRFDAATITKDYSTLSLLVDEAIELIKTESAASQSQLYYSLATTYSDFSKFKGIDTDRSTKKQLYYFRKSIELIQAKEYDADEFKPYILGFKTVLLTNYANALDNCGRKIAAIEQYKEALRIFPEFGMALGNLGRVYMDYGVLEYDPGHSDYFHFYAYSLMDEATVCSDPNTHEDAKRRFESLIQLYDVDYIDNLFSVLPEIPDYSYENPQECAYRKWALDNCLFLNTLNDLPELKFRFAADVIQLPSITTAINAKPIFHGMFNQIKQEYIYARYIYYSSLTIPNEPHYADKETYLLNLTDYPQYSIRIENLKSSFKTLYSLFDKIAYFINSYFQLGIKERDVSFNSIWKNTHGRGKRQYNNENNLNPNENYALSSLYWICQDFFEKFEESPNPNLQRYRDLRHAMEHKYLKVTWMLASDGNVIDNDGLALYVSESELYELTMQLMHIAREAIICLALSVSIEEKERSQKKDPNTKSILIQIDGYDDEWKT